MNKNDLKAGMLLETRFGGKYIYIPTGRHMNMISLTGGWMPLDYFNLDLTKSNLSIAWDIVKIYEAWEHTIQYMFSSPEAVVWNCVWNRGKSTDVEEISADEAMKRLEEQSGKRLK